MTTLLNGYIKKPLLYDLMLIALFISLKYYVTSFKQCEIVLNLDNLKAILSDTINTSISLAGFVLASLTIIVTFKDNINHKDISNKIKDHEDLSGMELIFTSKHYKRIVGVFSWSCFIFLSLFFLLTLSRIFLDVIQLNLVFDLIIIAIVLVTLTIFRCLLILHKIIQIQIATKLQ